MAILNFDATQVAPDTGTGDPVPAGWYNVAIDDSEMKPTKSDGMRLSLRFNILDGQYVGRKVFVGLNLKNSNPVAQEIAYKQLSAICRAVGVMKVGNSQELHGKPLKIKVKVKAAQGDYEASNDVSAYKNINEGVSEATAAAPWANQAPAAAPAWQAPANAQPWAQPAAQTPTPQSTGAAPPWVTESALDNSQGAPAPWAQ